MHAASLPILSSLGVVPVDSCAVGDSMFESDLVVSEKPRKECATRCGCCGGLRRESPTAGCGGATWSSGTPAFSSIPCPIYDCEVKLRSKHSKTCERCVDGFDHHCRLSIQGACTRILGLTA